MVGAAGAENGGAVRGFKEGVKEGTEKAAADSATANESAKTIDVDAKPQA